MLNRFLRVTRSPAGARFACTLALLCAAGAAGAEVAERERSRDFGPGPLPWRVAGRVGFTVDAAAFPDSAGQVLEVYVRVPPGTLASLARDSSGFGELRVSARLRAAGGGRPAEQTQGFRIERADSADGFGKVVALRFTVRPGLQKLQVRVEDALSRKRGIAYAGRQVTESSRVEGSLTVPGPQAGRDLSDIEFVWTENPGGAPSTFLRAGRTVLPNPERLYGLYAGELRAAFTARARPADQRPWRWIARVIDRDDRVVAERESVEAAGRWLHGSVAFDVSRAPAGGYDLELKAWQEGDPGALLRKARFSIAWQRPSWERNPGDVSDEVHFLLAPDDEEAFALLHPGEQERFLDEFWRERDPTAESAVNEAQETFLKRVEVANRTWGRAGLGKGMFSDMGRAFIRYGEPSEIIHQVIPTGDETLDRVLVELSATEDRPVGDVHQKGPGGDQRPFELWIYQGEIGMPPDVDPKAAGRTRHRRMVFLFVDEQGIGDYRLRYSTE